MLHLLVKKSYLDYVMRSIFLHIILINSIFSLQAKSSGLPDFTSLKDSEKYDSIRYWYLDNIQNPAIDSVKAFAMLNELEQEGKNNNDFIVSELATYYRGFYIYSFLKQENGLTLLNEALARIYSKGFYYEWAFCMHELGISYSSKGDLAKALEAQIRSYEVFKEIGLDKNAASSLIMFDLAYLYYHLGNFSTSLDLSLQAVQYLKQDKQNYFYATMQVFNTIALSYHELQKIDSALVYFNRAVDTARLYKDNAWIGIISGNMGGLYVKQGKYDLALPYVQADYNLSVSQEARVGKAPIADALCTWAIINIAKGNIDEALSQLKKAEAYTYGDQFYSSPLLKLRKHIYEQLTTVYIRKKDFANALRCKSMALAIQDTFSRAYNVGQYSRLQIQLEAEKNVARIHQLETERQLTIQRRNFSLAGLGLVGLFIFLLYNRQRLKNRKDLELHESRGQLLHSEKLRAEEQLAGYMENLHEKTRIIEEFEAERERLNLMPDGAEKLQTIEMIEKLQKSTIITEDEWIQFKNLFDKVHKGFFTRLKEKYSDLTQAEMRLLGLTKLNLSTKEMAAITGISPESIRKARYRFLKKVNDTSGEADINDIVNSI